MKKGGIERDHEGRGGKCHAGGKREGGKSLD